MSAARDVTIDFSLSVARIRYLGINVVQCTSVPADTVAVWAEDTHTVRIGPAATLRERLYVLDDLYALLTDPSHESVSVPTAHLTLVPSL